jgi:hypothetical protein
MMKTLTATVFVAAMMAAPVYAGGMAEPTMEPEVIVADTSASGGDDWVGVLMIALSIAAVVGN